MAPDKMADWKSLLTEEVGTSRQGPGKQGTVCRALGNSKPCLGGARGLDGLRAGERVEPAGEAIWAQMVGCLQTPASQQRPGPEQDAQTRSPEGPLQGEPQA